MGLKDLFKRKNKQKEIEDEIETSSSKDYRKLAEAVLKRFGVKNVEQLTNERLLEEFSKIPHPNTVLEDSALLPYGSILKSQPLDRIDGLIMGLWYAPDFIKTIIPDREFIEIWRRERNKKVQQIDNIVSTDTSEKILKIIFDAEEEFYRVMTLDNGTNIKIIDLHVLLNIISNTYSNVIKELFNITVPDLIEILNTFVLSLGYDNLMDFIALTEQQIVKNKKMTYIHMEEEDNFSIDDIIDEYTDIDNEEEDIFDKEENDFLDSDEDDDFDDNLFD